MASSSSAAAAGGGEGVGGGAAELAGLGGIKVVRVTAGAVAASEEVVDASSLWSDKPALLMVVRRPG